MASVSDDEIIKRKLLIEGDGGNDDRRLTSLLKMFVKWSQSPSEDEISNNAAYQRLISSLATCELSMEKSHQVFLMNLLEQKNYEALSQQIETQVTEAFTKIEELKEELSRAKRIRRNRQEYDALAKVIQNYPDREDMTKKLKDLDEELANMKETEQSLQRKLELRRKQFHVLISSLHELERILADDDEKEEEEGEAFDHS
ncbi:hypothetical protein CAPTEDRAFT_6671 [Capitella teleta]|uniref:THO complex subunit 7 homolog n=1 Tax=Capitella teleta TaxID=283909 RepID=R7TR52_CAPTE|nr:hypothetical protein CAPTEDRAFT_6671 [Capitella teleta]|eukprot:ELT96373.1 hypothetical protein CAPTEDRAFT_6671 [Capitella teleta]